MKLIRALLVLVAVCILAVAATLFKFLRLKAIENMIRGWMVACLKSVNDLFGGEA